jgi:hypothetical protein
VLRVREQLVDRAFLGLSAGVHHHDSVGDVGHHAEVMGDQDDGGSEPAAQLPQQVENAGLDGDVERCRGLVGDQDLGVARKGHRDHHALAHAARELVRVLADAPARVRDVHEVE